MPVLKKEGIYKSSFVDTWDGLDKAGKALSCISPDQSSEPCCYPAPSRRNHVADDRNVFLSVVCAAQYFDDEKKEVKN